MTTTFFRLDTDLTPTPVALEHLYAGPQSSACWLVGGGPSLAKLPVEAIARSPLPRMAVNLAGAGLLRPTFWTSYDPTVRFARSVYLDPGVLKFVHRRRALDLVPGTTFKVGECPGVLFFDRDRTRRFRNLIDPAARRIVDWNDSLVQALEILHRLGFRTVYLAGCDMQVAPAAAHRARAAEKGVDWRPGPPLADFFRRCERAGLPRAELAALADADQYHFDESKPLADALRTDEHYFRITQLLRLSRQNLTSVGLNLVSVTPDSRLNDFFPYQPVEAVLSNIATTIGDPTDEPTRGLYTERRPRPPSTRTPMRDQRSPGTTRAAESPTPAMPTAPTLIIDQEGWQPAPASPVASLYRTPTETG